MMHAFMIESMCILKSTTTYKASLIQSMQAVPDAEWSSSLSSHARMWYSTVDFSCVRMLRWHTDFRVALYDRKNAGNYYIVMWASTWKFQSLLRVLVQCSMTWLTRTCLHDSNRDSGWPGYMESCDYQSHILALGLSLYGSLLARPK